MQATRSQASACKLFATASHTASECKRSQASACKLFAHASHTPYGERSQASDCKLFANAKRSQASECKAELGERMQAFCECQPYGERMQAELGGRSQASECKLFATASHTASDCKLRGARRANASGARRLQAFCKCKAELGERMLAFCDCKPYGERMQAELGERMQGGARRANASYAELGGRSQTDGARRANKRQSRPMLAKLAQASLQRGCNAAANLQKQSLALLTKAKSFVKLSPKPRCGLS